MPRIPDAEIAAALAAAERLARARAPTPALAELAADKAADAVLRATRTYDRRRGPFAGYARSFVWLAVSAALKKPLPRRARPIAAENARPDAHAAPAIPPPEFDRLPPALRVAATLHLVHGYSLTDAALLSGCATRREFRLRLLAAAAFLAREP